MPALLVRDLHLSDPPLAARDLLQPGVERVELTLDPVNMDQQLLERFLSERIIELLACDPAAVQQGLGDLALAEDPPVPQELLHHRLRAASRAPRRSSRALSRSRSPSSSAVGGCTNRNIPAR